VVSDEEDSWLNFPSLFTNKKLEYQSIHAPSLPLYPCSRKKEETEKSNFFSEATRDQWWIKGELGAEI
jgi:hypothetical protein